MIRAGLQAVKSLELVKKQFQEFKIKYANSVPAEEVANYAALNDKLKHAVKLAQDKEEELQKVEESVEGVRTLYHRFASSGHLSPTVYNIFLHEYTQLKITMAPKENWLEVQNANHWRDFWNMSLDFARNLLCVGWMMGWETVDELKVPIILAGSIPLRAISAILEVITKYQVELQRAPPATVDQTFQFMNCVYTIPTEGAEVEVQAHEDKLMGAYSRVYPGNMRKVLQVLHTSPTN